MEKTPSINTPLCRQLKWVPNINDKVAQKLPNSRPTPQNAVKHVGSPVENGRPAAAYLNKM